MTLIKEITNTINYKLIEAEELPNYSTFPFRTNEAMKQADGNLYHFLELLGKSTYAATNGDMWSELYYIVNTVLSGFGICLSAYYDENGGAEPEC